MKQNLLTLFVILLFSAFSHAQTEVTAYEVPDLVQCNYEIFDLTVQINPVLGNQDPENYSVTFFASEANAAANVSPIANPESFVPSSWPQTIYIRVVYNETGEFDITSFSVNVITGSSVGDFNDVTICESYALPPLQLGNYYTGPNGTGTMLYAGDVITATTELYVYYTNDIWECVSQASYTVTVLPAPVVNQFYNVYGCGAYVLPALPEGQSYYTGPNGTGAELPAGVALYDGQIIYVYAQNDNSCSSESSFWVTILTADDIIEPTVITQCTDSNIAYFDLMLVWEQLMAGTPDFEGESFYTTEQDAANDVNPITNVYGYTIATNTTQTVYLKLVLGDCTLIVPIMLEAMNCGSETGNTLTGTVRIDADGNGCDENDSPASGVWVNYSVGNYGNSTFTDADGNYTFYNVPEGAATVWVGYYNWQNFIASPAQTSVAVPDESQGVDFCLTLPAPYTDVAAYIFPGTNAVPGFVAGYYIYADNYGTEAADGTLTLTFDPSLVTPSFTDGGVVSGNTITWNYSNLAQYQSLYHYITFTVAEPPVANSGTILNYSVTATTTATDVAPDNNTYAYAQTVVNSFDPNDITVREGEFITEEQVGDYIHYTIRFQNTGTANAQKVRVNLTLHDNLDWNTFEPIGASHDYYTNRSGGVVDFVFDNIQLPFEDADEPASHGSVSFRIKSDAALEIGDSFAETAHIYFDFNEAIVTNTAVTTVQAPAATDTFTNTILLYPNPASDAVTIQLKDVAANTTITITDVLGKTVYTATLKATVNTINTSGFAKGVYMVKVANGTAASTQKLVIN